VVLFYLTGMGFGCSYSLLDVDSIEFVKTSSLRKLARTVLGVAIALGLYFGIIGLYDRVWTEDYDQLTTFVGTQALPYFLISIFMYGPYVVLCKRLNLVGEADSAAK
jgi:hypothetical protein